MAKQAGMQIGILALQGDFEEHAAVLLSIGASPRLVRLPAHLEGLAGLIIPGGESTTIGKLAASFELIEPLRRFGQTRAVWGTCAGAIFLSQGGRPDQPRLSVMDIKVARNAFGRQVNSFEIDLPAPFLIDGAKVPFRALFIRAPIIQAVYGKARPLLTLPDGRIVAARQDKLLATAFHPELTADPRFHQFFLSMT